jgi:NADP-dependent 3-hydroxy acid dehydrogenase YdfG
MNAISQDFLLAGKVAWVTVRGRGIGSAVAKKLAEAGTAIARSAFIRVIESPTECLDY